MALMEFHISRATRDRYHTDQALFSFSGNVVFADVKASRELAHSMNQVRGTEDDPARIVHPGALFAMGLIDEASHLLVDHYRKTLAPQAITDALQWFSSRLGAERFDQLLLLLCRSFPALRCTGPNRQRKSGLPARPMAFRIAKWRLKS